MTQEPYPRGNAAVVPMLGRQVELDGILRRIAKATADHVSIVGPPYIGKTTLLRHLTTVVGPEKGNYLAGVFVDLRHEAPTTDDAFRQRVLEAVHEALTRADHEAAGLIDLDTPNADLPEHLAAIFGYLASERERLLVVLDGLDTAAKSLGVSPNLWDYLREIGIGSSCTFVTGSRGRLLDLLNNPDSLGSEFFNLFNGPVVELGPFTDQDWDLVLAPLAEHVQSIDAPAMKEMANWTGGHPALAALLCHELTERTDRSAVVSKQMVDACGEEIAAGAFELPNRLWEDCPGEVQGDLFAVATNSASASVIPTDRVAFAVSRGFMVDSGRKKAIGCRVIGQIALSRGGQVADLKRLFETEELYSQQIQRVLEVRLAQIPGGDAKLRNYVGRSIRELGAGPEETLNTIRLISRRALELIWAAELNDGERPEEWFNEWRHLGNEGLRVMERHQGTFPTADGRQCQALRDITGGYGNLPIVAEHVTRASYILVEHVKSAGDLGQHLNDNLSVAYAASICLACVELFARLAEDLPA